MINETMKNYGNNRSVIRDLFEFGNQRKALNPGDKPEVCFALCEGDEVEAVYAYCNLHSLWKA